jgi:hypothetical protein
MKTPFTISIEEDDAKAIKAMCEILGITVSKLFEDAVRGYVLAAKSSGILKKKKATPMDLVRLFGKGCTMDPHS